MLQRVLYFMLSHLQSFIAKQKDMRVSERNVLLHCLNRWIKIILILRIHCWENKILYLIQINGLPKILSWWGSCFFYWYNPKSEYIKITINIISS